MCISTNAWSESIAVCFAQRVYAGVAVLCMGLPVLVARPIIETWLFCHLHSFLGLPFRFEKFEE
jgi:hypothetical protein